MTGSTSDGEDLLQEVFLLVHQEARKLQGRVVARNLDLPAGDELLPRFPAQPPTPPAAGTTETLDDVLPPAPGRRRRSASIGWTSTRDPAAAPRLPRRVRAARCRGIRPRRSGRAARHRGGHLEVAGAQGAAEDSRAARARHVRARRSGSQARERESMSCDALIDDAIQELVDGTLTGAAPPGAGAPPLDLPVLHGARRGAADRASRGAGAAGTDAARPRRGNGSRRSCRRAPSRPSREPAWRDRSWCRWQSPRCCWPPC